MKWLLGILINLTMLVHAPVNTGANAEVRVPTAFSVMPVRIDCISDDTDMQNQLRIILQFEISASDALHALENENHNAFLAESELSSPAGCEMSLSLDGLEPDVTRTCHLTASSLIMTFFTTVRAKLKRLMVFLALAMLAKPLATLKTA